MSGSQIPISKNVASVVAGVHPGRWVNGQLLGLSRIRTSLFSLVLAAGLVAGLGFVRYKMLEHGPPAAGGGSARETSASTSTQGSGTPPQISRAR